MTDGRPDAEDIAGRCCPRCGYLLTGLPLPRCPECGAFFEPKSLSLEPRRRAPLWAHAASAVLAVVAVPVAICIPVWCSAIPMRNAPLFPALATGIEEMSLATFGWLLGVSGLVGVVGSLHAIVLALLLIVPLPAITLAEIIVNPRSHNLLPFELLLWIILFFVCMAGLSVGRILRWGITKSIEVARM